MNLPNIITIARILLVPVFVVIYLIPGQWTYIATAVFFGLAAFTDWLDGYLARRLDRSLHARIADADVNGDATAPEPPRNLSTQ